MSAPRELTRREALAWVGGAAAAGVGLKAVTARAEAPRAAPSDAVGMLYDAAKCTGCQACVSACSAANDLPPDTTLSGGIWQMPYNLNAQTKNLIRLCKEPDGTQSFFKHQCMHCIDPACVSGCPFYALQKGDKGIVTWDGSRCIGCRYCEIACPYDVPKFEWAKFNPKIVKCELCNHRLAKGQEPGCTEVCPTGAVIFGTREKLLAEAKARIAKFPGALLPEPRLRRARRRRHAGAVSLARALHEAGVAGARQHLHRALRRAGAQRPLQVHGAPGAAVRVHCRHRLAALQEARRRG